MVEQQIVKIATKMPDSYPSLVKVKIESKGALKIDEVG